MKEVVKPICPQLRESFDTLTVSPASNVDMPGWHPLFSIYKGKDGFNGESPVFMAYTTITILIDTLSSTDKEDKWMEQEMDGILMWIK